MLEVIHIDPDIFRIANLFTRGECLRLIDLAESIGFEAASVRTASGPKMMSHIRNNDRVVLNDPELAGEMWSRVAAYLPMLDGCLPTGVDSQLRFYRYVPGQEFKRHKDGAVTNEEGETSKLSYLVYLNDDCQGGATSFRDYQEVDGKREKIEHIVTPTIGSALLFRHERWHEGTPVKVGVKYVLRTDVFYSRESKDQVLGEG